MSQQESFGSRLRQLMKEGETQQQFGERVGINRNTIATYFKEGNEDRAPDTAIVLKLHNSCNVSVDWLLGLTEPMSPDPDIRNANAYTGLSEKALSNIHRVANDPTALAGLEHFMSTNFEQLLGVALGIYDYCESVKKIRETGKPTIHPVSKGQSHIFGITEDRLCMINAMMEFQKLLEMVGEF